MTHRLFATGLVALRRGGIALSAAAFAVIVAGHSDFAHATPWPLTAAEIARVDLAALTGFAPSRSDGEASVSSQRTRPREIARPVHAPTSAAGDDVVARFAKWLDSSEQDFQNVVMRRLSTPVASRGLPTGAASAGTGSGTTITSAIDAASEWSGAVVEGARTRLAALGEDVQRRVDSVRGRDQASTVVAQAGKSVNAGMSGSGPPSSQVADTLAPVTDWLEKSAQDFQSVIMRRLTVPSEQGLNPTPVSAAPDAKDGKSAAKPAEAAPKAASTPATAPPAVRPTAEGRGITERITDRIGDAAQSAKDWLTQSKREFQEGVVGKLSKPDPGAPPSAAPDAKTTAVDKSAAAKSEEDARAAKAAVEAVERKARGLRNAEEKAKADADSAAAKAAAAAKEAEADAQRRKTAVEEAARKAVADQKRADEGAAVAARNAAEDEAKRKAAEKAAAEQKAAKVAEEAARKAEGEAKRKAAEKAAADQKAAKVAEEAARKAEDEAKRKAAEKAAAEQKAAKVAEEAARKKAEEDAAKAAAAKQKEEAARMAAAASLAADAAMAKGDKGKSDKAKEGSDSGAASPSAAPTRKAQAGNVAAPSMATRAAPRADKERVGARPPTAVALASGGETQRGKPQSCRGAGRQVKPPAVYVVARGDSLWVISRRHYKHGGRWVAIHKANDDKIGNPDLIWPCQRFYIPKL